jgi:hypothetical protein
MILPPYWFEWKQKSSIFQIVPSISLGKKNKWPSWSPKLKYALCMNPLNCQVYNQQAWGGFTLISGTSSARYVTDPVWFRIKKDWSKFKTELEFKSTLSAILVILFYRHTITTLLIYHDIKIVKMMRNMGWFHTHFRYKFCSLCNRPWCDWNVNMQ